MKPIGGFFELELNEPEFSLDIGQFAFNSGSSALLFYLQNSHFKNILVPYYTCNSVYKVIKRTKLSIEYYQIDDNFSPIIDYNQLNDNTLLIYNNYFGLNSSNVNYVANRTKNILIDASQAFFFKQASIDYFNSARKFFGVPDGGLLSYSKTDLANKLVKHLPSSSSKYLSSHLLNRLEGNLEQAYKDYKLNEKLLAESDICKMSELTKKLLSNINMQDVKLKRLHNFKLLHKNLADYNNLKKFINQATTKNSQIPMCYPLLIPNGDKIKKELIKNKIFIPTYWPEIKSNFNKDCVFETELLNNLVCIPIDQRYNQDDMKIILSTLKKIIDG